MQALEKHENEKLFEMYADVRYMAFCLVAYITASIVLNVFF